MLRSLVFKRFLDITLLPAALFCVLFMRLIRPWFLIRLDTLFSHRLGHFSANTELYLCERDAGINLPRKPHWDLWYHHIPICSTQLARMWSRVLWVGPAWFLSRVKAVNRRIPGGEQHLIGSNIQLDRDVFGLRERFPVHLEFLPEEEKIGAEGLRSLGVPEGASFVCLNVRDSKYVSELFPDEFWEINNYRDCNIQNYIQAAEKLADRGYYVIRMGAAVHEPIQTSHPRVIDYATSGMRTELLDLYLGSKCEFCISTGTGFDAVPYVFRKPIVYVDHVPIGLLFTFNPQSLITTKKHWGRAECRYMTFREIFDSGAAYFFHAKSYEEAGIDLHENSPEDIAALVLEMEARLKGTWVSANEDEELQTLFWEIFKRGALNQRSSFKRKYGEFKARAGTHFLRQNRDWLNNA